MFGFTLTASAGSRGGKSDMPDMTDTPPREPTEDMRAVQSMPMVRFGFTGTARQTIVVTPKTFPATEGTK
jgi:hypothetical protein